MNEHDLSHALDGLYAVRMTAPAPAALRSEAWRIPVTIPQRRGWLGRFSSRRSATMFSSVKFVAAGLVVAIVGGAVIVGLQPGRTQDDLVPAVGASAAASEAPGPTMQASEPDPDLLPGVELEYEVVSAGVYRILSDGQRDLTTKVSRVEVSPDGAVFVQQYAHPQRQRWVQVGRPGGGVEALRAARKQRRELERQGGQRCRGPHSGRDRDGVCWAVTTYGEALARFDDDGAELDQGIDLVALGLSPDARIRPPWAIDGEGMVVATVRDQGFTGLVRGHADTWSYVPYEADSVDPTRRVTQLAVGADGAVWVVEHVGDDAEHSVLVHRWSGQEWESYEADVPWAEANLEPMFLDDGRVWFGPWAMFDGAGLHEVQALDDITGRPDIDAVGDSDGRATWVVDGSLSPDGTAWVAIRHRPDVADGQAPSGLFAIRPEELVTRP